MFRNVRLYQLDSPWPDSEEAVDEALQSAAFVPCGPLTERSSGWEPLARDGGESLARRVNGADLVKLRSQSRVLPAAAVNEELEVRVADYRKRMQEDPPAREKRRLKAEVRDELMPKSMVKSDRIHGYIDLGTRIVGIDSAQPANAERFLRRLKAPFGDLNMRPLEFASPVHEFLTAMFLGDAPPNFALGHECRMQDPADAGSTVRWSSFDLTDSAIRRHVVDGMRLTHLGLVYDNLMSFVLDENGVITKLKFLGVDDAADEEDDPLARLDAEFVLFSGTLRAMLKDLGKLLGGTAGPV
ncbi:MAG: recombination-associated protein RdgC [Woeseiaceae bacterium]|nr:recombination-associated protein RdgC [Woeseiaceae bacterium]